MVPCSPQPLDAPLTPVPSTRLVPRLTSNPLGTLSLPSTACCAHDAASNVPSVSGVKKVFCKLSRPAAASSSTGLRLHLSVRILRAQESAAHCCPRLRQTPRPYQYKLSNLAPLAACIVRLMKGTRTTSCPVSTLLRITKNSWTASQRCSMMTTWRGAVPRAPSRAAAKVVSGDHLQSLCHL